MRVAAGLEEGFEVLHLGLELNNIANRIDKVQAYILLVILEVRVRVDGQVVGHVRTGGQFDRLASALGSLKVFTTRIFLRSMDFN